MSDVGGGAVGEEPGHEREIVAGDGDAGGGVSCVLGGGKGGGGVLHREGAGAGSGICRYHTRSMATGGAYSGG